MVSKWEGESYHNEALFGNQFLASCQGWNYGDSPESSTFWLNIINIMYVSEGTCGEIKLVKGKSLAFPIKSTQFASQI